MHRAVAFIVFAEMLGTSLWFSTNGVIMQIKELWHLSDSGIGVITNSVQLGFIFGTLLFVVTGFADRYKPSVIVALCCLTGALANFLIVIDNISFFVALLLRFLVGMSLAGIYPVGMKLIITWDPKRAANSLSLLVGMLVMGSALPYLIRAVGITFDWQYTIAVASILCVFASAIIFMLGDGPYLILKKNQSSTFISDFIRLLKNKKYISSALGYFGHMWELYAFWTCVPLLLTLSLLKTNSISLEYTVSLLSFFVIGIGCIGCVVGGIVSKKHGSPFVVFFSLILSGFICLIYPLIGNNYFYFDVFILLLWGFFVISDSPHFSAISSTVCPKDLVGTALTLQNCVGFSISMITIYVTTFLYDSIGNYIAWILLPGPVLGLVFFIKEFGVLEKKKI